MGRPRFEIVHTDDGVHVRYVAGNGEPVLAGEVLTASTSARKAIASVRRGAPMARVVVVDERRR